MKIINTNNAPSAIGPYSQAIDTGNVLYVSGQVAIDPKTGCLNGNDITSQTQQVFRNIEAILQEAGYNRNQIVKCNVFLVSLGDFAGCNAVYAQYFGNHKPARACVAVSGLVKNALVEIDAVAIRNN